MDPGEQVASLVEALGFGRPPELVSVVGGGGKSSLLFALARALPGRTVLTTTTRIFAAQLEQAAAVCSTADPNWRAHLESFESNLLVVGGTAGDQAVGVEPALPYELLQHRRVDWVVVEADGSRMRPVKAPAEHEPVIPPETDRVVCVAGIDALEGPIASTAHRPERVSAVTGIAADRPLTPASLAALLTAPQGGLKNVPERASLTLLLNKVETGPQRESARRVARHALGAPRVERVVIGALRDPACAWEIRARGEPSALR